MSSIDPQKPILVTGATGYIASRIVKDLLEKGHTVRATVRNKGKKEKYAFLQAIADASTGTLEIWEGDLLHDGAFDKAAKGCELVMHTASPFILQVKNPQKQLIDPALKGTRNVLNAVNKAGTVKRVVLTSSVVAMYGNASEVEKMQNGTLAESMWNKTSSLKDQPYAYSKTLAEKEAWKIAKAQKQWDMVTIHPAFVMGPSLTKSSNSASLDFIKQMMGGEFKMGVPPLTFGLVDVREVSAAHIAAGFTPEANGRYITARAEGVSFLDMGLALGVKYGDKYKLPKKPLPKFLLYIFGPLRGFTWKYLRNNLGYRPAFDNQRTQAELKVKFRPWSDTLNEHVEQMIKDGMV